VNPSPQESQGFGTGDLAILGNFNLQTSASAAQSVSADVATLIWEARTLTAEQVHQAQGLEDLLLL
jgi:hypothetical protein